MDPRRLATLAATLCRMEFLPACVIGLLAAWGAVGIETRGTSPVTDRVAPSLAANAEVVTASRTTTNENAVAGGPEVVAVKGSTSEPIEPQASLHESAAIAESAISDSTEKPASEPPPTPMATHEFEAVAEAGLADSTPSAPSETSPAQEAPAAQAASSDPKPVVVAALGDPTEKLPTETSPVQAAISGTADPAPGDAPILNSVEIFDECFVADACIDRYLWALYQRTPKEDTIKVEEQSKVTVKRKGKMVTVTRTSTRLVDEDFAWKDPKAAARVNMTMMDYVIGGMDHSFKLKLFNVLRAAEQAGLSPGITSAFRDDYRQSIASGLKAATDRSYHGGSFRGGYGHGLAADIVSIKGATRLQRQTSSETLWKWVDTHGREFGIGRPYLDRDPPHVAPIDGQEYASHRGTKSREAASSNADKRKRVAAHVERGTKSKQATISSAEKRKRIVAREDRSPAKRPRNAKSS